MATKIYVQDWLRFTLFEPEPYGVIEERQTNVRLSFIKEVQQRGPNDCPRVVVDSGLDDGLYLDVIAPSYETIMAALVLFKLKGKAG